MLMYRRIRIIYALALLISTGLFFLMAFYVNKTHQKRADVTRRCGVNKLVDMSFTNDCFDKINRNNAEIKILFINKPRHVNLREGKKYIHEKCRFKNCILTDEARNISQASAVVFNAQDDLHFKYSHLIKARKNAQIWVIYRAEPIGAVRTIWFRDTIWKNTMNWTWGYRLDSDIFLPHQTLVTRKIQPKRDYFNVYRQKTKMAAWIVSNCHAGSRRKEYVRALINEGIKVDIYGRCSKNKTRVDGHTIREEINTHYLFYLSFENNFCKDYVSEKFFNFISLDTILIVRGGLNYSKHFDKEAFIDASSFPTVHSLARYMFKVSSDFKLYRSFLQAKDRYLVIGTPGYSRTVSMCRLCEHMNNRNMYKRTYYDIASYLENRTCFNPELII